MDYRERFRINQPLENMELAIVKASLANPDLIQPVEENIIRSALSLSKMNRIRHEQNDIDVSTFLNPFREDIELRLRPLLHGSSTEYRNSVIPQIRTLHAKTQQTLLDLNRYFQDRLPEAVIEHEMRHKSLVLVLGGGGGTGYVYVGVMELLEELGLRPSLMVGTSIGAILALFRSRLAHFEKTELINIVRGLSWPKLFRTLSTESRYGLPAPLRLYLRAGIGRYFTVPDAPQTSLRLSELPVPTIISVSGIRKGMLPHPIDFYEHLFTVNSTGLPQPFHLAHGLWKAFSAIRELTSISDVLVPLHMGMGTETDQFDALDAAGFSSSLPGVIHYDILRDDDRMHQLVSEWMRTNQVSRLVDGGLTNNLPAEAARQAIHEGKIGTRNAFILGLNGFSLKLSTPLWLPIQQLAEWTVARNRPYAHLIKDFRKTLSPLNLVPSVEDLTEAISLGRAQMMPDVPLISRILAPLEPLRAP